jgi:hypothetical protein
MNTDGPEDIQAGTMQMETGSAPASAILFGLGPA